MSKILTVKFSPGDRVHWVDRKSVYLIRDSYEDLYDQIIHAVEDRGPLETLPFLRTGTVFAVTFTDEHPQYTVKYLDMAPWQIQEDKLYRTKKELLSALRDDVFRHLNKIRDDVQTAFERALVAPGEVDDEPNESDSEGAQYEIIVESDYLGTKFQIVKDKHSSGYIYALDYMPCFCNDYTKYRYATTFDEALEECTAAVRGQRSDE